MRSFRRLGTALVVAGLMATGIMASSARLHATGFPGGGTSPSVLCILLQKAIEIAETFGDSYLVDYLKGQCANIEGCTCE